jgi:outer membrane lipoprotein-sorting protein
MGRRRAACFWLLTAALAPSLAGTDDFMQRVRARLVASQPFRVDFIQQVVVDEEMTLEESGVIVFAGRDRVKWQYLAPAAKTFLLENGRYRFYDSENNQLLQGRLGERGEQLIWELLFSDRPGSSSRWDPRERTITISLAGENGVQELQIHIGPDFLPLRVEQKAVNDVTTVYIFSNYRPRVALGPGEFDLDLPADVEIIEESGP